MVNAFYPKTLKDALLARKDTMGKSLVICGGSDAMVVHKTAENVIFVNDVAEMKNVSLDDGMVKIGASVTYSELIGNEIVPEILKCAMRNIASPAIRNVGTIAGNICNASPAGDTIPVLYALNAKVQVSSVDDRNEVVSRFVPVKDFILGIRKIDLRDNELVSAVCLEQKEFLGYVFYYEKVGARRSEAISKASFAALYKTFNGKILDAKVSFGSVGITALRFEDLEEQIKELSLCEFAEKKDALIEQYMERINPIDDQRSTANYRKTVCKNLLTDFFNGIK